MDVSSKKDSVADDFHDDSLPHCVHHALSDLDRADEEILESLGHGHGQELLVAMGLMIVDCSRIWVAEVEAEEKKNRS